MDRVLGNKSSKKAKDPDLATLVPKPAKTWSFSKVDMCSWSPWEQIIRKVERPCFGVFSSKTCENMVFSKVDMCRLVSLGTNNPKSRKTLFWRL